MKHRDSLLTLTILVVCLIALACGTETPAGEGIIGPKVSENYVYYNINGATANDLRHQMDRFGPADERRVHHDAYTEWYVDWHYSYVVANDGCERGPITVTVSITQTFPKWDPPPEAPPSLIKQWNTYLEALQLHENGHREIGIEAGEEVLRTLSELSSYPTCGELEQIADRKGQIVLDEYRQKEVNYDRTTEHGERQEARFP